MFDLVKLSLYAGDGGNGKVSFRREKFIPKGGPDGGVGGHGGSIYLVGDKRINTLQHFAGVKEFRAQRGQDGGKQKMIGHKGDDITLRVPLGTIVWLLAENTASQKRRLHVAREGSGKPEIYFQKYYLPKPQGLPPAREDDELQPLDIVADKDASSTENQELVLRSASLKNIHLPDVHKHKLAEITADGQTVVLVQGGLGGRGNVAFKGSTNTTPMEAEYGTFGEKKIVLFELKLLADVGLVGYPNAGKSTFLSIMTKANPKIANYPFTTLEPNLGVMSMDSQLHERFSRDIVIADIPGLIEGASQGKGLGFDFLRHVQACKVLLYVLALDETTIFDKNLSDLQKAKLLLDQFTVLKKELGEYDKQLVKKPTLIGISKLDVYSPELVKEISAVFRKKKLHPNFFSSMTQKGVEELRLALLKVLESV